MRDSKSIQDKESDDYQSSRPSPSRTKAEGKFEDDYVNKAEAKDLGKIENYTDSKVSKEEEMMDLINKVQDYFFGSDILAKTFEDFVREKSDIIDLKSEEYKLTYTEVFDEYKALFESKMEYFLESVLKSNSREFYLALKYFMDKDEYSNESIFAQILVAVTDFDVFMTMMREAAKEKLQAYGRK